MRPNPLRSGPWKVLPREVRKLASVIEERDAALAHRDHQIEALEFTNEKN